VIQVLDETQIDIAINALKNDELCAIPTETVYGLAGNAFSEIAVAKIFEAKKRPFFDPLIVHLSSTEMNIAHLVESGILSPLTPAQEETFKTLSSHFSPGPLTFVLPKGRNIPDLVTAGLPTVGIRFPSSQLAGKILSQLPFPLAAPSANRFGRISPTCAQDVIDELKTKISYVLDGGSCSVGIESTIVKINPDASIQILRPGKITLKNIKDLGIEVMSSGTHSIEAPGQLNSHYAPEKKLTLIDTCTLREPNFNFSEFEEKKIGLITLFPFEHPNKPSLYVSLSKNGKLDEVSRNLFSTLRSLDSLDCDVIQFETPSPNAEGLEHAILNRLNRAASDPH